MSTFYRYFRRFAASAQDDIRAEVHDDIYPRLHWVDNFAKYYASTSMFANKSLLQSCQWTAHGFKRLPKFCDLLWHRDLEGESIPALPHLDELLSDAHFQALTSDLQSLSRPFLETSIVYSRDVRRVPLKIIDENVTDSPADGLKYFVPVDMYSDNIATLQGLVSVLHVLQRQEGFGLLTHSRYGRYSLLHVDVKIFWQLLRMLYSFPEFAGIRHDMFLIFGLWHAYHYSYIALWHEFRHTFLAAAFFLVFPNQKLMRRPKLSHSATFCTWLRLAYPPLRAKLLAAIEEVKERLMSWQISHIQNIRLRVSLLRQRNPHLAPYVHLLNLHALFEFCLPCIQDYGCALKGNDWPAFYACFRRLLLFFVSCSSKGASEYSRSMFCFDHLLRYWFDLDLPVASLLRAEHTAFSEESGEIALSVLVHSQPPNYRSDLQQTRNYWHLTRQRYLVLRDGEDLPRTKKHRIVGNALLLPLCLNLFRSASLMSLAPCVECLLWHTFCFCKK